MACFAPSESIGIFSNDDEKNPAARDQEAEGAPE
jgi:hypothetical protein